MVLIAAIAIISLGTPIYAKEPRCATLPLEEDDDRFVTDVCEDGTTHTTDREDGSESSTQTTERGCKVTMDVPEHLKDNPDLTIDEIPFDVGC
jgi:hypothetical protein